MNPWPSRELYGAILSHSYDFSGYDQRLASERNHREAWWRFFWPKNRACNAEPTLSRFQTTKA
jgi:hypothetical protein